MVEDINTILRESSTAALNILSDYYHESFSGSGPVVQLNPIEEVNSELHLDELIRQGGLDHKGLQAFLKVYLANSMRLHHPAYLGHQVATPHPANLIGGLLQGIVANPMSIYEMGPSAAAAEQAVIRWMLEKVGWQESGGGVLTHGGSIANLHAMLAARAKIGPNSWKQGNPENLIVLCPFNAHYSISRAVAIMGLGEESIWHLPTDHNEMIIPRAMITVIEQARKAGKQIMAVVANACATATGLYDPIDEIAAICSREEIWFHLDSAHGATALLSVKYRHYLQGIESADSLIWDAHKLMQTSALCTGILFKDRADLEGTFSQKASYLFHEKDNPGVDTLPNQLECTKAALGTRLFLVLATIGEKGMGNFMAKLFDHTRNFAHLINQTPGFSCPFPTHANIICFTYLPEKFNQLELRNSLIGQGNYYVTCTEIKGKTYFRLVIMNLHTSRETISNLLDEIVRIAHNISTN